MIERAWGEQMQQRGPRTLRNRRCRWVAALLLAALLSACGDGDPARDGVQDDPRALCLSSDCGARRLIADLPQLENIAFTSSGRLFVSGQQNLYEIQRTGADTYRAFSLFEAGSGCGGLTEQRGHLYALCSGGLYAVRLDDPVARPVFVSALSGMTLPNGMAAGEGNRLYIADGPIAVQPKIIRVQLDATDPLRVLAQDTWLSTLPEFPNGVAIRNGVLYTTLYVPPLGTVAAIEIQADGSAGPIRRLALRGIYDDIAMYGDTLLVADFQNGALLQYELDGTLIQQTGILRFAQPSSVHVAGPPLFDQPTALATQRYLGRGLWAWERFAD